MRVYSCTLWEEEDDDDEEEDDEEEARLVALCVHQTKSAQPPSPVQEFATSPSMRSSSPS